MEKIYNSQFFRDDEGERNFLTPGKNKGEKIILINLKIISYEEKNILRAIRIMQSNNDEDFFGPCCFDIVQNKYLFEIHTNFLTKNERKEYENYLVYQNDKIIVDVDTLLNLVSSIYYGKNMLKKF